VTNNRLLAGLAGMVLGMSSLGVAAKGLNYTYGEIGYTNFDSDTAEADGATVRISYGATDNVHIKLQYSRLWVDTKDKGFFGSTTDNVNSDRFIIGGGGNFTLLEKASIFDALDMLGTLSYYDLQNSGSRGSGGSNNSSDRGWQFEGGVRALIRKKFEITAGLTHLDIDTFDDTGFHAGAVYNFYKKYSVTGDVHYFDEEDTTEYFVGLRMDF